MKEPLLNVLCSTERILGVANTFGLKKEFSRHAGNFQQSFMGKKLLFLFKDKQQFYFISIEHFNFVSCTHCHIEC